jgi:hypothetical protein
VSASEPCVSCKSQKLECGEKYRASLRNAQTELRESEFVRTHVGMLGKMHEQVTWTGRLPDFVTMPQLEAPKNFNLMPSNAVAERVTPVLAGLFPYIPSSTIKSIVDEKVISLENGKRQSQLTRLIPEDPESDSLSHGRSVSETHHPLHDKRPRMQPSLPYSGDNSTVGPSFTDCPPSFLSPSNGNCTTTCS